MAQSSKGIGLRLFFLTIHPISQKTWGGGSTPPAEPSQRTSEIPIPSFPTGNRIRQVTGLDPERLTSLHTLELRGNQLETTTGINLPKLKNLYLVAHWALRWHRDGSMAVASSRRGQQLQHLCGDAASHGARCHGNMKLEQ